jgi:N-acetylglucosamine-6-sulfatase
MRSVKLCILAPALLAFLVALATVGAAPQPRPRRPNLVVILLDDLRWDEMGCTGHPFAETPNIDRIAREGARFTNAFATTPLCSPSRASFLTGRYPHGHGIVDNVDRSAESHRLRTFPRLLHDAGYETAYVGKWHMGTDDSPRPGFDYWLSVAGQGTYQDPELNENGRTTKSQGYVTDRFNERAVAFVRREHRKPFLLYIAHKAVHPDLIQFADGRLSDPSAGNFVPAARHRDRYAGVRVPRRPNAGRAPEGKPALQRRLAGVPPLGPETGTPDETVRNRQRMLLAVEEGVGQLLAALRETGQLDDTVVVFTSDHGYFYGEHGLSVERRLAYEEAIRIPLLVRYPPLVRAGATPAACALSIDLAPTLLELGGAPIPDDIDGRSLLPLMRGERPAWRRAFLVEYFSDTVFPRVQRMGYRAVRTGANHPLGEWKLIHYTELQGMDELYELNRDPYELKNRISDPAAQAALATLRDELERLSPGGKD